MVGCDESPTGVTVTNTGDSTATTIKIDAPDSTLLNVTNAVDGKVTTIKVNAAEATIDSAIIKAYSDSLGQTVHPVCTSEDTGYFSLINPLLITQLDNDIDSTNTVITNRASKGFVDNSRYPNFFETVKQTQLTVKCTVTPNVKIEYRRTDLKLTMNKYSKLIVGNFDPIFNYEMVGLIVGTKTTTSPDVINAITSDLNELLDGIKTRTGKSNYQDFKTHLFID